MSDHIKDIRDRKFQPLPLGEIIPKGWLKRQLEIQAEGLSGHLDEFWPDLKDNRWLGGTREGWERGPYYADGLVPLAFLLNNDRLIRKSKKWIEAFLGFQNEEGWIGPTRGKREDRKKYDPWPNFVVLKSLRQYYEVTGDSHAKRASLNFARYLRKNLSNRPLFQWGKFRWGDAALNVHWLFEKTNERWLLQLSDTLCNQGYDWRDHFTNFKFKEKQPIDERKLATHVVNNAMGLKAPGVRFRQSRKEEDRESVFLGLKNLDKFHGQATGMFAGDEHLAGKDPSRGTELCAVVELMYSLEKLVSLLGDPILADRLERIAFNALPATFKPDMWAHQYDQQANQVLCNVSDKEWSNGPDANIFGLEPEFGCCTANMHQGWPKFTTHLFMKDETGLVAVAYSPCEVRTEISETEVTISEDTDYPFADEVNFALDMESPVKFSLKLRIPGWVNGAKVETTDRKITARPGTFKPIEKEWQPGEEIRVSFDIGTELERRSFGAVSVKRGPLVFSKPVKGKWKLIGGEPPHGDWEVYPIEAWNYGLDTGSLVNHEISSTDPGPVPFSPKQPPVTINATGGRVNQWELVNNSAGPIPRSPVLKNGAKEEFVLIPYGCTNLRVTEFPVIEKSCE